MTVRLGVLQFNPTVGAVRENEAGLRAARARLGAAGADLVVTTELALSGYPPEDLVLKPFFLDEIMAAVERLRGDTKDGGPALLLPTPYRDEQGRVYNSCLLLDNGSISAVIHKTDLPNYGVFDEKRVFQPGRADGVIQFRGLTLGIPICEDIWAPDVPAALKSAGAEVLVVPNGSPFEGRKHDIRVEIARGRVQETGLPMVYVNQVGGQDDLVFDGASFVLDHTGAVVQRMPSFRSHETVLTLEKADGRVVITGQDDAPVPERLESLWHAMALALGDYVNKNRFPGVVLGLSGGIDSAVTAAVAVDVLGPDRVWAIMLPSPYTSDHSLEDAEECAKLLGIRYDTVPIMPAMQAFEGMFRPLFNGREADITEENVQSRIRAVTLMGLSNKFGHMLVTTGNKSEMAVGYATLYGDMCGGYSVLKDVYKTDVFALAEWRNAQNAPVLMGPAGRVIPQRIITKPPSAELKPDQTDQDSLPPYDALDDILECLIEEDMGLAQITARGHDEETVRRVWTLLDRAEYKRRQSPPGVKLSRRAFSKDRRYPITNATRALLDT